MAYKGVAGLLREISILTNRVHGPGLVRVDMARGRIELDGKEVQTLPAFNHVMKKGFVNPGKTVTQRHLHRLVAVLEQQAEAKGLDVSGVRFKCTSKR